MDQTESERTTRLAEWVRAGQAERDAVQVEQLLKDAVQDITYAPDELSSRLRQLKESATAQPARPVEPQPEHRLRPAARRASASSTTTSQEAGPGRASARGNLALAASADLRDSAEPSTRPRHAAPLRGEAQRNLEHVLRAAREVFGELGYGAPMEDVARRARVGVGTVYRRFPSKDVLVRRIAEEEIDRLTDQARRALGEEDDPWQALVRFLRVAAASGTGRLIPVPHPQPGKTENWPLQPPDSGGTGMAALLDVLNHLIGRAQNSGDLRADVTAEDLLMLISTSPSSSGDPAQAAARRGRLLDILVDGLRGARSE